MQLILRTDPTERIPIYVRIRPRGEFCAQFLACRSRKGPLQSVEISKQSALLCRELFYPPTRVSTIRRKSFPWMWIRPVFSPFLIPGGVPAIRATDHPIGVGRSKRDHQSFHTKHPSACFARLLYSSPRTPSICGDNLLWIDLFRNKFPLPAVIRRAGFGVMQLQAAVRQLLVTLRSGWPPRRRPRQRAW